MRLIALIVAACMTWPAWADAPRKIALVIGNDAYESVPALERAVADARAYRDQLRDVRGFEIVYAENADRATMIERIGEFLARIRPDDVAMMVYSGHGVQIDPNQRDTLYLLPTDIQEIEPDEGGAAFRLDAQAVNFARLSEQVARRGAGLRIFVLDACRNNPFPQAEGGRSVGLSRGLGAVNAGRGEFVFFAAAPGNRALDYLPGEDDSSPNSVFTRVFLRHFKPGTYLEDIANEVQEEVLELSRRSRFTQEPYYSDGVPGKTCIDERCGAERPVSEPAPDLEASYWRLCESKDDPAYCSAYLDAFPQGPRAPLARLRLRELGRAGDAPGASEPAGEPPAAADSGQAEPAPAQRSEAAATNGRGAEPQTARRQPAAAADAAAPDAATPDPEAGEAAQRRQVAREAWLRLRDSWDASALREFRDSYPESAHRADAEGRLAFLHGRFREAQRELNRLGYQAGPVDGLWGPRSAGALRRFQADHALRRTGALSEEMLRRLRAAEPKAAIAPREAEPAGASQAGASQAGASQAGASQAGATSAGGAEGERVTAVDPDAGAAPAPDPSRQGVLYTASATTRTNAEVSAKIIREGDRVYARIDVDMSTNPHWPTWKAPTLRRECNLPPELGEIRCWMRGMGPDARLVGSLPELELEGGTEIGHAMLHFDPAG